MSSYGPRDATAAAGSWTDIGNAAHDGGGYAVATAATTDSTLYGFDFAALPSSLTVDGIEIRVDALKEETSGSGTLQVGVELSWDGGTSWTTSAKKTGNLTTTETTYTLGGAADTWGRSWTRSELQANNFRMRIRTEGSGIINTPDWRVEYATPTVTYADTTALTLDLYEALGVLDSSGFDALDLTLEETVAVNDGAISVYTERLTITGDYSEDIEAITADFQSATGQRNSPQAFAASIVLSGPTGRQLFVGDASIHEGWSFQPIVIEWGDILLDGAPGVSSRTNQATIRIRNGPAAASGIAQNSVAFLRSSYVLGSPVTIYAGAKQVTWQFATIFVGFISSVSVTTEWIEIQCAEASKELVEIPVQAVQKESMNYGTTEGKMPDDFLGAVVPIAMGRFTPDAMEAWGADHPFTENPFVAPLIGVKSPMVPIALMADFYQRPSASALLTTIRQALFAEGDRANAPILQINYPEPKTLSSHGDTAEFVDWVQLWTWNTELDRGTPFMRDYSFDQPIGTEPLAGAGSFQAVTGLEASSRVDGAKFQGWYINRTTPVWSADQAAQVWSGTIQAVALTPDALSAIHRTTAGITFGTTAGVVNPLEAISTDPKTFATITAPDRLSVQLRPESPALGDPWLVRICWITEGSSTATQVRVSHRRTWNDLQFCLSDWNTTASGDWILYNASTQTFGSMMIQGRTTVRDNWRFVALDYGVGLSSGPQTAFAFDVSFTPVSGNVKIIHVWMEVVYKPRFETMLRRSYDSGGQIYTLTGGYDIPHHDVRGRRSDQTPRRIRSPENNLTPAEVKGLGSFPVYLTGYGSSSDGTYTGGTAGLIENPVDMIEVVLDKYMGELIRATGNTFGGFGRARTQLNTKTGGGANNWRLSAIVQQKMTARAFIDSICEQSMSFCMRQPVSPSQYIWRMFVDSHQPQTDSPERLYRTTGGLLAWTDIVPGSFVVSSSDVEDLANNFILRYGFHEPTRRFAYQKALSATSDNLESAGSTYRTAMQTSANRYGISRQLIVDAPYVWSHKVADQLIKWHANLRRERRVIVEFETWIKFIDLQPGHIITFSDDIGTRIAYPGFAGTANWAGHYFNVVSVAIRNDPGTPILVKVVAVEVYAEP